MDYNCCDVPYSQVKITVELRRKYRYYMVNLVLPCGVFSCLSMFTFVLPPACGERVAIGQNTRTVSFVFVTPKSTLFRYNDNL